MTEDSFQYELVDWTFPERILFILGQDLIKDEMAGVVELVKNAYDADASQVTIAFRHLGTEDTSSLTITDNGHGMTKSSILNGWLCPATPNKGTRVTSPGGRLLQGRKGIGRLSAMRLGSKLLLETAPGPAAFDVAGTESTDQEKTAELSSRYRISFDWEGFETSSKLLRESKPRLGVGHRDATESQGTRLEIGELRDEWNFTRIGRLIRELKLLLAPIAQEGAAGVPRDDRDQFDMILQFESCQFSDEEQASLDRIVDRPLRPYPIPEIADYIASASIDAFGNYEFLYERMLFKQEDQNEIEMAIYSDPSAPETQDDIRRLFSDDGRRWFPVYQESKDGKKTRLPLPCGPLSIDVMIWDRDVKLLQAKTSRMTEDIAKSGVKGLREYLDNVSGISIYRDGFRVRPYGDEDKDWLNLGQRRVQRPVMKIGPNQVFGVVDISIAKNPGLDDKASREGLKEDLPYQALTECLIAFLGWIEPHRHRFRERNGLGRPQPDSTRELVERRKDAFSGLREQIGAGLGDTKTARGLISLVEAAEKASDDEHHRFTEQTKLLHDTHAIGMLSRFVLHEGRNFAGTFQSSYRNIRRVTQKGYENDTGCIFLPQQESQTLELNLGIADRTMHRLDSMLDQLDPLTKPRRPRRSHIVVEDTIRNVLSILKADLDKGGVQCSSSTGKHRVRAWESDLFHALYNMLLNSIFWLGWNDSNDRRIDVVTRDFVAQEPDQEPRVEVIVADNGRGVSEESAPYIFDLGYSDKTDGTGVGLFIAREGIERSGGSIELLNPGERGARFQILLQGVQAK